MKGIPSRERPIMLCVDDDAQLLETLEFLLVRHFPSHRVLACVNGRDALEQLDACKSARREVQLVLSDQVMDDISGIEVLSRVPDYYPDAIRIILTGQAGLQSAIDAIKLGIADYLEKPVTELELVRTIRNHLTNYMLKKENRRLQDFLRISHLRASEVTDVAFRNFNLHLGRLLSHQGERREVAEAIRHARENIQLLSQLYRLHQNIQRGQTLSRFTLDAMLAEAEESLHNRDGHDVLAEKQQRIQHLGAGYAREIQGHRAIMRVVLERVLDNAWKYSPPGALLTLTVWEPGKRPDGPEPILPPRVLELLGSGHLVLTLQDESIPSPEDYQNLCYAQEWQSVGDSASSALRGLGLVIAQEYLYLIGGHQFIDAAAGQKGVTVHLAFPVEVLPVPV